MEKISGIIPTSRRVRSVNLKDSPTVRPGAPSYGAPRGKASINGGDLPSTAEKAVAAHKELMARRSGDSHKPEIIQSMTDQFFMRNETGPGGVIDDIDVNFNMDLDSQVAAATHRSFEAAPPSVNSQETAVPIEPAEWLIAESNDDDSDYTPPGSYIDVQV